MKFMSDFRILKTGGSGEIVEKKSRFIATCMPVTTKEEAMEFVAAMKKKYYDARHNCYAYVLGDDGAEFKSSDDGEPSGTAGRPMLEVINGEGVTNLCVVVTRYFGGTLLGTGGLIRAYTDATKEGLANSEIVTLKQGKCYDIPVSYTDLGKLQNYCKEDYIKVEHEEYGENVVVSVVFPIEEEQRFKTDMTELFAGKVSPVEKEEKSYYA